MKVDAIVS